MFNSFFTGLFDFIIGATAFGILFFVVQYVSYLNSIRMTEIEHALGVVLIFLLIANFMFIGSKIRKGFCDD
jgi:hypothetical protein